MATEARLLLALRLCAEGLDSKAIGRAMGGGRNGPLSPQAARANVATAFRIFGRKLHIYCDKEEPPAEYAAKLVTLLGAAVHVRAGVEQADRIWRDSNKDRLGELDDIVHGDECDEEALYWQKRRDDEEM
jgi:hypothetical protein